jgi:hypothetical protein
MTSATEAAFAQALRDRTAPIPDGVIGTPRRFGIYRNNVASALTAALAARFPIVERIVGQEFFRAMASSYARENTPRRAVLLDYGDTLPGFIERFGPAEALPYLPDMARLEIARSEAYHAADAEPASELDLAALAPERLAETVILPHPATRLVASDHPIAAIAAMHAPGATPHAIETWTGEAVLVTRPRLSVLLSVLPFGGHAFYERLLEGGTIAEAVAAGLVQNPAFDPASALAGLIAHGAILGFLQGDSP